MLVKLGLLKNRRLKSYQVFTKKITKDFMNDPKLPLSLTPSQYVSECWKRYQKYYSSLSKKAQKGANSLNGKVFELIIVTALYRNGILPFYYQAKAELVPDIDYDVILFDEKEQKAITISIKTSARERYKQAALEAFAFKSVHRSSLNYLVMEDSNECKDVQVKIRNGTIIGLQQAIDANSKDFDSFIKKLSKMQLGKTPTITLFKGIELT